MPRSVAAIRKDIQRAMRGGGGASWDGYADKKLAALHRELDAAKRRRNPMKRRKNCHTKRRNGARSTVDKAAARELFLYIENDGQLYRQMHVPIIKNLARKVARGTFDKKKAVRAYSYLMKAGAKKYVREIGGGTWHRMFNKATRDAAALTMLEEDMEEIRYQATLVKPARSRRKNPHFGAGGYITNAKYEVLWQKADRVETVIGHADTLKAAKSILGNRPGNVYNTKLKKVVYRQSSKRRKNPGSYGEKLEMVLSRKAGIPMDRARRWVKDEGWDFVFMGMKSGRSPSQMADLMIAARAERNRKAGSSLGAPAERPSGPKPKGYVAKVERSLQNRGLTRQQLRMVGSQIAAGKKKGISAKECAKRIAKKYL